ncbi:hypothetical protein CASFOL_013558 [Castilleja foliolosa]|uniref:Uncharacterized protein n=1 Tax=Castilleja foliolosa TaxID=1961234 RepID=A0ABD3DKD6_9LAMI
MSTAICLALLGPPISSYRFAETDHHHCRSLRCSLSSTAAPQIRVVPTTLNLRIAPVISIMFSKPQDPASSIFKGASFWKFKLLKCLTLAPLVVKVDPNLNVILTACLTVYVSCYRSLKPTLLSESMCNEHAMRFPLVGSSMLLSLFLLFKFLSKDLVNAVLTAYFFVLGIVALSATLLPAIKRYLSQPWNENVIVWRFPLICALEFDS